MIQLSIGVGIGAITFWWAIQSLDLRLMVQTLLAASPLWIIMALGCVLSVSGTKAARWGALYGGSLPRVPFWELFSILVISQMVNIIVPLRIGELVRLGMMKQAGHSNATTISTIIVEKTLDLITAGLIAIALVWLALAPPWLNQSASSLLLLGLIFLGGLLTLRWRRTQLEQWLVRFLTTSHIAPMPWREKLLRMVHNLLNGLAPLTDKRIFIRLIFWTLLVWLFSVLTILSLFLAFNLSLTVIVAIVLTLTLTFSNLAPVPGLVGVIHLLTVFVLGQYGVERTIAFGFGTVVHVIIVGPLLFIGSWSLWTRSTNLWPYFTTYLQDKA